jgi:small subunit ribosomal protein S2
MSNTQSIVSFTVEDMLRSYVHFGHRVNARNPKMSHNIYKSENGIHIIDVRKSFVAMNKALVKVYDDAKSRKSILFVGTNPKIKEFVMEAAEKSGQHYVCQWCCGMMTNWRTIVASIKTLKKYNELLAKEDKQEDESLKMTKKEMGVLQKKRNALHKKFGGITNMGGMPDLIIVMSARGDDMAIREAECVGVPVIAIVDTNASTDNIAYPIPGNDDSIKAIRFYCNLFVEAILGGIKADITKSGGKIDKNDNTKAVKDAMSSKAFHQNKKINTEKATTNT